MLSLFIHHEQSIASKKTLILDPSVINSDVLQYNSYSNFVENLPLTVLSKFFKLIFKIFQKGSIFRFHFHFIDTQKGYFIEIRKYKIRKIHFEPCFKSIVPQLLHEHVIHKLFIDIIDSLHYLYQISHSCSPNSLNQKYYSCHSCNWFNKKIMHTLLN